MMASAQSKAEHGVIQSSIGLLQERFRQLQRMKEMRENKQLLPMFSDYKFTHAPSTSTTLTVTPPLIFTTPTNNYFTTTSTATTTTSGHITNNNINDNNNNQNDNTSHDEELQIFIPPNYMSNKNRKVSCYSSPSSSSSVVSLSSSASPSSSFQSHSNHTIDLNDVTLSLWPPTPHINTAATNHHCRRASVKEVVMNRPTCFNLEDPPHFSDVDTTLHL